MQKISYFLVLSLLAFFFTACGNEDSQPTQASSPAEAKVTPPRSRGPATATPEKRELSRTLTLVGYVDAPPPSLMTLNAPVAAFVDQVDLIPGRYVQKGQVLLRISHPDMVELQRAFLESREQRAYLRLEKARQDQLAAAEAGVEKERQRVSADLAIEEAHLAALAQRLRQLNLDTAELTPGNIRPGTALYAPFSGYVTEVMVNQGSFVPAGQPMLNLIDGSHLHLELEAYEQDLPWVQAGQRLRCQIGSQTFEAEIFSLGATIDRQKRSLNVHAHPVGSGVKLRPGAYVQARIETEPQPLLAVPQEYVWQQNGQSMVRIKGEAHPHPVVVLSRQEGWAYLAEGHGLSTEIVLLRQ